jgi:hypothetical protein
MPKSLPAVLLALLILAACATPPAPTPVPALPAETPVPASATPAPTATPQPSATLAPTETPVPTPTPAPLAVALDPALPDDLRAAFAEALRGANDPPLAVAEDSGHQSPRCAPRPTAGGACWPSAITPRSCRSIPWRTASRWT